MREADPRDYFCALTPRELAELRRALLPGECLRWGTRPVAKFWQADTPAVLIFGGLWTAFMIVFTFCFVLGELRKAAASNYWPHILTSAPPLVCIVILLFFIIGIFILLVPWWQWSTLRHTFYLITDKRAVIVSGGWIGWNTRAFELHEDMLLWRRVQKDAQGDLVFEAGEDPNDRSEYVGFLCVPDAQLAERKLREAIAGMGEA